MAFGDTEDARFEELKGQKCRGWKFASPWDSVGWNPMIYQVFSYRLLGREFLDF